MGRYRIEGVKTYRVRVSPKMESQVFIDPEWLDFVVIEGLNHLEGNKQLDEHYESLLKKGNSKEWIGRVEEFRQRYNRGQADYVRDESNEQHKGI